MTVYLSEYIHPDARKLLEERAEVVSTFDEGEKVDAIILRVLPVDAKVMDQCPNLKVIGKHGVGCNTIDLDEAKKRCIPVINTPRANTNAVAELIVGLTLNAGRNITLAHNMSQKGDFKTIAPREMTGVELSGKVLGLVGTGNIARRAAEILCKGFGMRVIGYDPYVTKEAMEQMGYEKYDEVNELIRNADIINVSVPFTPETVNLISGDSFNCFKKDALLINAARGGIVNEAGLYQALKEGKIRAAACDAFVEEPPTGANTNLYELDNFIGTPHIGAGTEESLYRMGMEVVQEVTSILDGAEPVHRVV